MAVFCNAGSSCLCQMINWFDPKLGIILCRKSCNPWNHLEIFKHWITHTYFYLVNFLNYNVPQWITWGRPVIGWTFSWKRLRESVCIKLSCILGLTMPYITARENFSIRLFKDYLIISPVYYLWTVVLLEVSNQLTYTNVPVDLFYFLVVKK